MTLFITVLVEIRYNSLSIRCDREIRVAYQRISLGIIGTGLIGKTLLNQLVLRQSECKSTFNVDLQVNGIMSSQVMLLGDDIELSSWMQQPQIASDLKQFTTHLLQADASETIIIDCTASDVIAQEYLYFFEQKIHVVTPNKKANAGSLEEYKKIKRYASTYQVHYLYEATVGAGLPIIKTLNDLILSGDRVLKIEGVLSGTLQYIFSRLSQGNRFSEIILDAKQQGFTEPDPRQDLSGMDVARKLICLARELGVDATLDDVVVQNLIPSELSTCTMDDFFKLLPEYDDAVGQLIFQAQSNNEMLRYVGSLDEKGQMDVCIRSFPNVHPYSTLPDKNNLFMFYTERYNKDPLIIQGPVLGEALTVSAILGDLVRIITSSKWRNNRD